MTLTELLQIIRTRFIEVYGDLDTELSNSENISAACDEAAQVLSNINPIKHYPPTTK